MRLTPRVAGFRSEYPAGFKLECMAGFVGTRRVVVRAPPALPTLAVNQLAMRAPPSGACTRFCGDWLDCTGRSHGIACFEVRSDFRFGLAFPFFRLGEPKETSGRIAHCELAKLRF